MDGRSSRVKARAWPVAMHGAIPAQAAGRLHVDPKQLSAGALICAKSASAVRRATA